MRAKQIDLQVPDRMTAGIKYLIHCKATGAYPRVNMAFSLVQNPVGTPHQLVRCRVVNPNRHMKHEKQ